MANKITILCAFLFLQLVVSSSQTPLTRKTRQSDVAFPSDNEQPAVEGQPEGGDPTVDDRFAIPGWMRPSNWFGGNNQNGRPNNQNQFGNQQNPNNGRPNNQNQFGNQNNQFGNQQNPNNGRPNNQNQFGNDQFGNQNNQFGNQGGRPNNQGGNQYPNNPFLNPQNPNNNQNNQFGNQQNPNNNQFGNQQNPNNNQQNPNNGQTRPNNPQATTPAPAAPTTAGPTPDPTCLLSCPVTPEYNPVCGTNRQTYTNMSRLECARRCGLQNIAMQRLGPCRG